MTTGPGDGSAAGTGGRGHWRASRADREQVISTLKAAFVQGRLGKDEFDLRVGQTFASRTCAELASLTADLPAGFTAARPAQPAGAPGGRAVARPGRVITAAAAVYAGAWAYVWFLAPHSGEGPWTRPLILDGTVVCLGIVIICLTAILIKRRDGRSGGQPPRRPGAGGHTSRYLPPPGPDGPLRPADPGHRHAAEAARREPGRRGGPAAGQPGRPGCRAAGCLLSWLLLDRLRFRPGAGAG